MTVSSARTLPGRTIEIVRIARPFSNFGFIDANFQGLVPLRRLMSEVRQLGGRTMVIERLPEEADLLEEDEDIRLRHPGFGLGESTRLTFFTKPFSTLRGLLSASDVDFLGYAIIKEDALPDGSTCKRIYESAVRQSKHPNNCIRGQQVWEVGVGPGPSR